MHESGRMSFELLDTDSCEEEPAENKEWSVYVQKFLENLPGNLSDACSESLLKLLSEKPVFLHRYICRVATGLGKSFSLTFP